MTRSILSGFLLLLVASPLWGETYSWVDDSGTYNFTEDYSRVPKKYRKKVKLRGDMGATTAPVTAESAMKGGAASVPGDVEKEKNSTGRSRTDFRRDLEVLEVELGDAEQNLQRLRTQIFSPKEMTKAQFDKMKNDYEEGRLLYEQTYRKYTALVETIRASGIPVEIRKIKTP